MTDSTAPPPPETPPGGPGKGAGAGAPGMDGPGTGTDTGTEAGTDTGAGTGTDTGTGRSAATATATATGTETVSGTATPPRAAVPAGGAALPRYVQISEMLIREIAAGHLAEGTRLPPERDMAASLGTSVGTLRKALADLAAKGLLDRVQGSGNYVRARPVEGSVYAFFRLERVRGGGLPTAQVLNVERLPKPEAAPPFGPSAQGHRIRRLRRLDGEPIALEEIWLDGARTPRIREADLSESLYLFYRRDLHLVIGRVEDRIGTAPAPDWRAPEWLGPDAAAGAFGVAPGQPAGHVERLGWDQSGAAVEYSRTWFDGERARYVSRMGKG